MPTCEDVRQFCNEDTVTGLRARQICPKTCGCEDPRGSLALWGPSQGCPKNCQKSGPFRAALDDLSCKDVHSHDTQFVKYLDNWVNFTKSMPGLARKAARSWIAALRTLGCDFLNPALWTEEQAEQLKDSWSPYMNGFNLCTTKGTSYPVKPLSYFCPKACGCHTEDNGCPGSCPARNASDQLCPAHQRQCRGWRSVSRNASSAPDCPRSSTANESQSIPYTRFCPMLL